MEEHYKQGKEKAPYTVNEQNNLKVQNSSRSESEQVDGVKEEMSNSVGLQEESFSSSDRREDFQIEEEVKVEKEVEDKEDKRKQLNKYATFKKKRNVLV